MAEEINEEIDIDVRENLLVQDLAIVIFSMFIDVYRTSIVNLKIRAGTVHFLKNDHEPLEEKTSTAKRII